MSAAETIQLQQDASPALSPVRSSAWLEQPDRLTVLTEKIERGERLNNQERLERQGIIFNHSGKCGKIIL